MKKIFTALLLLTLLTVLISCGNDSKTTQTTTTTTPVVTTEPIVVFMHENSSQYKVVYPSDYADDSVGKEALDELRTLVGENSGTPFEYTSDYTESDDMSKFDGALEILLGDTNRKETEKALEGLREKDYVIKIIDKKLVVVGGSEEASAKAIKRFAAMFFAEEQSSLVLRESFEYKYSHKYKIDSLTICGNNVYKYVITYDSSSKKEATLLAEEIREYCGFSLETVNETENTGLAIAVKAEGEGYSISCDDKNLVISAKDDATRAYAVRKFVRDNLSSKDGSVLIESSYTASGAVESGSSFKLLNLNVYPTGYAENSVKNRYPRLMSLIGKYSPDIICLQDVSPTWLSLMKEGIGETAPLTDKYAFVGIGRNNDDESAMNPIFYDKEKYTLVDSNTFWLSETPEWESVGWDGYSRCICTWIRLKDNTSGEEFVVMNAHLDPYGRKAQASAAALIVEKAAEFSLPVIIAGDYQSLSTANAYKRTVEYAFMETSAIAKELGEVGKTVNAAFGNDKEFKKASDFVFTSSGDFDVKYYGLLKDKFDGLEVSSHWAILCELSLTK